MKLWNVVQALAVSGAPYCAEAYVWELSVPQADEADES